MEEVDIPELVESLGSPDDSHRKRAAFSLQGMIGDPSFTHVFESSGGLAALRILALTSTGNTLAYGLASFSRLLELDQGWKFVEKKLIARLVHLVVAQSSPLNVLRGAMSILALIVAYPNARGASSTNAFGFRALKSFIETTPNILEILAGKLSSAEHALCANALQLINALMRDSITNDADTEWPKFVSRLKDLGVVEAVYVLMQNPVLQDLAQPLHEFQFLTKMLLRKWRETLVDMSNVEHRRSLGAILQASILEPGEITSAQNGDVTEEESEKGRKIGFLTETPVVEFQKVGLLGVMDLTTLARMSDNRLQKLLLEQAVRSPMQRCPIARASIAITLMLYDHFDIDSTDSEDHQRYAALEARSNFEKIFKPLLLQWTRLHASALQAFLRLWATTGAEIEDFSKIDDLVRILIEHVVGLAPRTRDIGTIEHELAASELSKLRDLQMELLELTQEDAWGHHLRQVKDELHHEALQFMREQRIRCLLAGEWFANIITSPTTPLDSGVTTSQSRPSLIPHPTLVADTLAWRYVRLSHNRQYLHYADFVSKPAEVPGLADLNTKVDLSHVSSVVSSTSNDASIDAGAFSKNGSSPHFQAGQQTPSTTTTTTITILGKPAPEAETIPHFRKKSKSQSSQLKLKSPPPSATANPSKEAPLLTLQLTSITIAAEWLDGLLMLLNKPPLTTETKGLIKFVANFGLKIRLLNVRFEEASASAGSGAVGERGVVPGGGYKGGEVVMPGREGVDDEFFYDVAGA